MSTIINPLDLFTFPYSTISSSVTFPKFIELVNDYLESYGRKLIKNILETADYNYLVSEERKKEKVPCEN